MIHAVCFVVALLGTTEPPQDSFVVYEQLPDFAGGPTSDALGQLGQQAADDFRIDRDAAIVAVEFWGYTPDPTLSDDFTIDILTSRTLAGREIPFGRLRRESVGNLPREAQTLTNGNLDSFRYVAVFDRPLQLAADTDLWISIWNNSGGTLTGDPWGWGSSATGNDYSVAGIGTTGSWNRTGSQDLAFRLYAVPTPAVTTLFVGAVVSFARRRR